MLALLTQKVYKTLGFGLVPLKQTIIRPPATKLAGFLLSVCLLCRIPQQLPRPVVRGFLFP